MEEYKLEGTQEVIDRLIDNGFDFEYLKDSNEICLFSRGHKEKTDNLYGFHYVGVGNRYIVSLDNIELSIDELMCKVFEEQKKLLIAGCKEKLKDIIDQYLGE